MTRLTKPLLPFCKYIDSKYLLILRFSYQAIHIERAEGLPSPTLPSLLFLLNVDLRYASVFHALELAEGGGATEAVAARGDAVVIEQV